MEKLSWGTKEYFSFKPNDCRMIRTHSHYDEDGDQVLTAVEIGRLEIHTSSLNDLRKLAELFTKAADHHEATTKDNPHHYHDEHIEE